MIKNTACLIWLLALPLCLGAQGTERYFGGPGPDRALAMLTAANGDLVLAGNTAKHPDSLPDILFMRTDPAGHLLVEKHIGLPGFFESANVLLPAADGGFLLAGDRRETLNDTNFVNATKVDAAGNTEWVFRSDSNFGEIRTGTIAADGNFILAGRTVDASGERCFISKISPNGQEIWTKTLFPSLGINDLARGANGFFYAVGEFYKPAPFAFETGYFILKINALGEAVDTFQFYQPYEFQWHYATSVKWANDGNLIVCGYLYSDSPNAMPFVARFTPELDLINLVNVIEIPDFAHLLARDFVEGEPGQVVLAGEARSSTSNAPRKAWLRAQQLSSSSNFDFKNSFGGPRSDFFNTISTTSGGGYALAGQTSSFGDGSVNVYLVITDSTGYAFRNRVRGLLRADENFDCQADSSEAPLENWLVEVAGADGTRYGLTDSLGRYEVLVDTGAHTVRARPPADYWTACLDSVPFLLPIFNADTTIDFAVQPEILCPLLSVDVAVPLLRRCFENTYFVHYQNYGTSAAPNARLEIGLDPFLEITGADLPYTLSPGGDTLVFELGNVPIFGSGDFKFRALVDCDSSFLGQTHCVEAHIFPDSLCSSFSPTWDFSNLTINGLCLGDSVILTIANTGTGNMAAPVEYVIAEDLIIIRTNPIQLLAGEATTIVLHPGGSTIRLTVSQTAGNPYGSSAAFVIEGCGGQPGLLGIPLLFPPDDADPWTDIECRQNIGSFDPNDKSAMPLGLGQDLRQILQNTDIEYLIRFQNTGTDTAFRVEIRDTLAVWLDAASLRRGASSHPYRFEMKENGALRFVFDHIRLPDSTTHFDASQGFVKFRISQKPNLAPGTRIENRAAIYFDFNLPVLTNTVWHTVNDRLDLPTSALPFEPSFGEKSPGMVRAVPNPFSGKTLIAWGLHGTHDSGALEKIANKIELFDAAGRRVWQCFSEKNEMELDGEVLQTGVYFLKIRTFDGRMLTGKLVKF